MIGDRIEVPDLVESIRGIRCWGMRGEVLCSINGTRWDYSEPLHAYCKGPGQMWFHVADDDEDHDCPGHPTSHGTCMNQIQPPCGIYAFKDLAFGREQYTKDDVLWGEVLLWGKHYTHEHGYRAEYARPACFYDRPGAEAFAVRYGVPLVPFPTARSLR